VDEPDEEPAAEPDDVDTVFDGVGVLEPPDAPPDESEEEDEEDEDAPSFFVSPEPVPSEAAGVEALLAAARESVL
jgi:hypothetical protein